MTTDIEQQINAIEDHECRIQAVVGLGKLGNTNAIIPLVKILKNRNEDIEVRSQAALALGKIGDTSVIEELSGMAIQSSESPTENAICIFIIDALSLFRAAFLTSLFIRMLENEDVDIRKSASSALVNIGKPAIVPLVESLADKGRRWRWFIVDVLGKINDDSLSELFLSLLGNKSEDTFIRRDSAKALGKIRKIDHFDLLVSVFADVAEGNPIRRGAIIGLGYIGKKEALLPLTKALLDEDRSIRWDAATALGILRNPQAIEFLAKVLQEDTDLQVRVHAAEALGTIGDKRAIPILEALIRHVGNKEQWLVEVANRAIQNIQTLA